MFSQFKAIGNGCADFLDDRTLVSPACPAPKGRIGEGREERQKKKMSLSHQSARHVCDGEDALSLMLFTRVRDPHRPLVPALCVRCRRGHCPLRAGCRRIRHRHLDPPSIHREREALISHRPRLQPPERHIRSALCRIHRRQPHERK